MPKKNETQTFDLEKFRGHNLPSEKEIISLWQRKLENPKVSVICASYNQKKYIEDALRGFLLQKTDFPFEVIAHDDASTDGTADVIREYSRRYPKIIKPVIQRENRYSKGDKPTLLAFEYAAGDYIAFCEGDDFWIDDKKLQCQTDALDTSPVSISFHMAYIGQTETCKAFSRLNRFSKFPESRKSAVISPHILVSDNNQTIPTASIVIRRSVLENMPSWFRDCPVGDYYIQCMALLPGGGYFVNEAMSFYRLQSVGSWSASKKNRTPQYIRDQVEGINSLKMHYGGRYDRWFDKMLSNVLLGYANGLFFAGEMSLAKQFYADSMKYHRFLSSRQCAMYLLTRSENVGCLFLSLNRLRTAISRGEI